jgi:putative chitinase
MITARVIQTLNSKLDTDTAETIARHLQAAADQFEINTKRRIAHFLAQIAHESGFRAVDEKLKCGAKGGMKPWEKPSTAQPGDSCRFRGRGFIRITGRDRYTKFGKLIQRDLADAPELALQPEVSALLAAAYWRVKGLNLLADRGGVEAVEKITRKVNREEHGLQERRRYFLMAEQVLG